MVGSDGAFGVPRWRSRRACSTHCHISTSTTQHGPGRPQRDLPSVSHPHGRLATSRVCVSHARPARAGAASGSSTRASMCHSAQDGRDVIWRHQPPRRQAGRGPSTHDAGRMRRSGSARTGAHEEFAGASSTAHAAANPLGHGRDDHMQGPQAVPRGVLRTHKNPTAAVSERNHAGAARKLATTAAGITKAEAFGIKHVDVKGTAIGPLPTGSAGPTSPPNPTPASSSIGRLM